MMKVESRLLSLQVRAEESAREIASDIAANGTMVLVIYDRTACDGKVFANPADWDELVNARPVDCMLYDLVLELGSTASLPDPNAYEYGEGCANPARQHSRADTLKLVDKFQAAYEGHPWYRYIAVEPQLWDKFKRVISAIVDRLPAEMRAVLGARTAPDLYDSRAVRCTTGTPTSYTSS